MTNVTSILYIFEAILLSFIIVVGLVKISIPYAQRVKLLDWPYSAPHKQHTKPMPLAGGLVMVGALLVSGYLFGTFRNPEIVAGFLAGMVVFVFGLWDDFRGIPPLVKFFGQTLAVVLLIRMGMGIRIFESPEFFLGGRGSIAIYLDWLFTLFWVVGITNAFNFVDSMDGLAVGLGGIAAAFFTLVTLDAGQAVLSMQSALLLGICIALYYYNSFPALLFLGDSGAQTLGFFLAVLAIAYRPQGVNQSSSWFIPILLLGVPIFDATLVVISRLRRKRPVYAARLDHTYHRLIAFGWTSNRAVLAMQLVAMILSCLAFIALTRPPIVANILFGLALLAGIVILAYLDDRKRWS